MKNQVQLITYADRFGGGDLKTLHELLVGPLKGLFGGIHLLPFFYPIDGADTGFDPIDHSQVDKRLGNWKDIETLGQSTELVVDLIVNHISSASPQYQDFMEKGENSTYAGMFLTLDGVFPNGVSSKDLLNIYRPRENLPLAVVTHRDGRKKIVWTTFTPQQIDIDVTHPEGLKYLTNLIHTFSRRGVKMIRLDAIGYAIKTPGTTCFMTTETYGFIDQLTDVIRKNGMETLVEIHAYYKVQIEVAKRVDWVYDFALPPLILHSLLTRTTSKLKEWLSVSPRNAVTVLDTHDGIGIVDIGSDPDGGDSDGLLDPLEIEDLVEQIHANSSGISRKATGEGKDNLDLYQVNCTYYDALGRNDTLYLLARLIQFFSPGIPQVYYMGLLAGENDLALFEETGTGRNVNRSFYDPEQVESGLQKPVVQALLQLIRFRNTHPAFDGDFTLKESGDEILNIMWQKDVHMSQLVINLKQCDFTVSYTEDLQVKVLNCFDEFCFS